VEKKEDDGPDAEHGEDLVVLDAITNLLFGAGKKKRVRPREGKKKGEGGRRFCRKSSLNTTRREKKKKVTTPSPEKRERGRERCSYAGRAV